MVRFSPLVLGLLFGANAVQAAPMYTVTPIAPLPGFTGAYGNALTNNGQVAGTLLGPNGTHAFRYASGVMIDLGSYGIGTEGMAINATGNVAGFGIQPDNTVRSFVHNGTTMIPLGTLGGSAYAYGINDLHWVVGQSSGRAFLYQGGPLINLGTLGGGSSFASAINNAGAIAGLSATGALGITHAFLHNGATMLDLGTLGGTNSYGRAINANGWVAGESDTAGNAGRHAFRHDGTTIYDLGTLGGGTQSFATGINAAGWVVGNYRAANASSHAFVHDGDSMLDLTSLIAPTDPLHGSLQLVNAMAINDNGQILALGGILQSFILTPVVATATATTPEPSALVMFGIALFGLGVVRRLPAPTLVGAEV